MPSALQRSRTDHVPVLADEVRGLLAVTPGDTVVDATFGAGDSCAAGLTYGLAEGLSMDGAVALAARSGAAALSRRGAHGA